MKRERIDFTAAREALEANVGPDKIAMLDDLIEDVLDKAVESDDPVMMTLLRLGSYVGSACEQLDSRSFLEFVMSLFARIGLHDRALALVEAQPQRFHHGEVRLGSRSATRPQWGPEVQGEG